MLKKYRKIQNITEKYWFLEKSLGTILFSLIHPKNHCFLVPITGREYLSGSHKLLKKSSNYPTPLTLVSSNTLFNITFFIYLYILTRFGEVISKIFIVRWCLAQVLSFGYIYNQGRNITCISLPLPEGNVPTIAATMSTL